MRSGSGVHERTALVGELNLHQSSSTSVATRLRKRYLRHLDSIFILRCGSERAMRYSYRSACVGAIRDALRAGT